MSGPASGAGGADLRDDRELLAAHVAGDAEAFGTLFARHRDRLWAVALRTTSDPEDAADALQDAMVAAFRRADSFRGEAAVTTWLHRIVVNACLDRLRRRKVRLADPLPEDLEQQPAPDPAVAAAAGVLDPADLAVDDERRTAVLAALDSLPPDQRAALVLVDMEGYSVEETARILDCAPGTVKSRCSRGRARLLPLLVDHRPGVRTPAPPGNQSDRPRVAPPGPSAPGELSDAPPAERPGVVPSAGGEDR